MAKNKNIGFTHYFTIRAKKDFVLLSLLLHVQTRISSFYLLVGVFLRLIVYRCV